MSVLDDRRVEIVLGQRLPASESPMLARWSHYECAKEEFVFSSSVPDLYYGHTNNLAVRRSVFDDHGPFLERQRGSDTVFVRQVVAALGDRAVVFRPEARVQHLELTGPRALMQKLFIYGRSSVSYGRIIATRPLSYRERWHVFRRTVDRHEYSARDAAILLTFLIGGVAAWTLGVGSALLASPASPRVARAGASTLAGEPRTDPS
jgi:hypothetical protein